MTIVSAYLSFLLAARDENVLWISVATYVMRFPCGMEEDVVAKERSIVLLNI